MTTPTKLAEDAARLLSYGLRPTLRPSKEPDYDGLLERYRSNGGLRDHVHVIARGLGLIVLGETELGLVLGAREAGPFAMNLAHYRRNLSVADRMCHGLIQLAIAAWCFPTPESLEDPDSISGARVSTRKLVEYLVNICHELEAKTTDDPDACSPELREAWRTILARAETRSTPDKRRTSKALDGMVDYALESLANGGLMRRVSAKDDGIWQALSTYRLQVRELAAHELAVWVREAAARTEGGR